MANARAHMIIHGRVQGVFFRYSTRDAADPLNVTGWVRNRREGTVEVVAEGERSKVEELVSWCRHGPPHARVTEVEVTWEEPTGEFDGFQMARTV
jgi:acylphosphatase